jgi:peptidoglycan/LPS O-acetylase OafA/YrhL
MPTAIRWQRISLEYFKLPQGSTNYEAGVRRDSDEAARVQTLRGLACLLVATFHTVGSSSSSGLHVPDESYYRQFFNLIVHGPMPLFAFVSGLVYAYRPVRPGDELAFSLAKLRRLGVPLIAASTLLYLVHFAMHHQVPPLGQMWTIYIFPYWHLWFTQALLLVFAAIVLLESIAALATFPRFMLALALSAVVYSYGPFEQHNILGIHNATYLLPFFLAGIGAHRFRDLLLPRRVLLAILLCFLVSQGYHTYVVLTHVLPPIVPVENRPLLHLVIGLSASLCALQLTPSVRLMQKIGGSSYVIYLYHPLFIAAALLAGGARGPLPTSLLFVFGSVAGIAGPMLMERAARRIPLGRLLLEGQSLSSVNRTDRGRAPRQGSRRPVPEPVG